MISGIKKDTGSFVYMRLKKHVCPDCGQPVFLKKIKKKIKSDSRAAKNYDFHIGDVELKGTVKFMVRVQMHRLRKSVYRDREARV